MEARTKKELDEIIKNHQHWLYYDCDGWENMRADLCCADLRGADLCGANLFDACLRGANLRGADLRDADLRRADLCCADLCCADLRGADLCGANLCGAINIPFLPMACPDEGSFIGWKKINSNYLIKLEIPKDAKRLSATTRKCRCDKARVLEITNIETDTTVDSVVNEAYIETTYRVGEMVYPDSFDDDRWNECSHGIHFFINKQEAINY